MSNPNTNSATSMAAEAPSPIQQNPNKLSGAPTIGKHRVHARTLIDYFAEGLSLSDFLVDFEGTPKEDALAVLSVVRQAIEDGMLTNLKIREENLY